MVATEAERVFMRSITVMEVLCHIPRREHIAVVVTTDKSVELLVVALSASLFELDFRFLLFKKHFLNVRNQRKSSSCGIGFQPGLYKDLHLTVFVVVTYDLTLDCDSLVLEVDCIPPQTKYLASSKTIICCNVHYKFQFVALENLKQFIQLISIVEGSFVPVSSRYYQLVHRVLWYQFHFYSVGECGMQCQIILLCGTALAATIQFVVEIVLNVVMIDLSKCEIRIMVSANDNQ